MCGKRILIFTNHFDPEQFKINDACCWLTQEGMKLHIVTGWPNYPEGKIYKVMVHLKGLLSEKKIKLFEDYR